MFSKKAKKIGGEDMEKRLNLEEKGKMS